VTLRTRWLTIDEGGHVSNSSSIYGTRPVKILWSMLPPLKLLNSSGPTRIPSYLKSNSTVCRPGETARPGEAQASNLQACGGCDMHLAQRIGAELAITGTVQKVSNLILNMNIYVRDVSSGATTAAMSADMRGNTDETWSRPLDWLVRNRLLAPGYGLKQR
jgi:hypothetical protein